MCVYLDRTAKSGETAFASGPRASTISLRFASSSLTLSNESMSESLMKSFVSSFHGWGWLTPRFTGCFAVSTRFADVEIVLSLIRSRSLRSSKEFTVRRSTCGFRKIVLSHALLPPMLCALWRVYGSAESVSFMLAPKSNNVFGVVDFEMSRYACRVAMVDGEVNVLIEKYLRRLDYYMTSMPSADRQRRHHRHTFLRVPLCSLVLQLTPDSDSMQVACAASNEVFTVSLL